MCHARNIKSPTLFSKMINCDGWMWRNGYIQARDYSLLTQVSTSSLTVTSSKLPEVRWKGRAHNILNPCFFSSQPNLCGTIPTLKTVTIAGNTS